MSLHLEIITPSKSAYNGDVNSVTVPGTLGSFQILTNHAPIISTIEIGAIKIEKTDKSTGYFATSGGTVEVLKNNVRILADSVEALENIDIDRARRALERAQQRLKDREENLNVARAEAALARAMNRIKLAEKNLITH